MNFLAKQHHIATNKSGSQDKRNIYPVNKPCISQLVQKKGVKVKEGVTSLNHLSAHSVESVSPAM